MLFFEKWIKDIDIYEYPLADRVTEQDIFNEIRKYLKFKL